MEKGKSNFLNIERIKKWLHPDPDQAARWAMQEKMERSFTHVNPPPPSVPTVNDDGELIWEEAQQQSELKAHRS